MYNKKLPYPFKHKFTGPDALGFYRWMHIQDKGDCVYDRCFSGPSQLLAYVNDRYGVRFENSIREEMEAFEKTA